MRYLITFEKHGTVNPYYTNTFNLATDFIEGINMVVFDLFEGVCLVNSLGWFEIEKRAI